MFIPDSRVHKLVNTLENKQNRQSKTKIEWIKHKNKDPWYPIKIPLNISSAFTTKYSFRIKDVLDEYIITWPQLSYSKYKDNLTTQIYFSTHSQTKMKSSVFILIANFCFSISGTSSKEMGFFLKLSATIFFLHFPQFNFFFWFKVFRWWTKECFRAPTKKWL